MSDESSKTMMVDERQSVRQVLDSLLDKSHCGYSPDWALVETITELQMGTAPPLLSHLNIVYGLLQSALLAYGQHLARSTMECAECAANVNSVGHEHALWYNDV